MKISAFVFCCAALAGAVLSSPLAAQTRSPQALFSTYVGGSISDTAVAVGHDAQGFLYLAGNTTSLDFPLAGDPIQNAPKGGGDIFLVKIDPNVAPENRLVYATYFGGSAADSVSSMYVSPDGIVYLAGTTTSANFPTANAPQTALKGTQDAFAAVINPALGASEATLFSTYLGGLDLDGGTAVGRDGRGRILFAGWTKSADFPVTGGSAQTIGGGGYDGFFAMVDPANPTALAYSTFMGSTGFESVNALATAPNGVVWLTGVTYSADFTIAGLAFDRDYGTKGDAFLVGLRPDAGGADSLVYSTYFGGSDLDEGTTVAVLPNGRVAVGGYSWSTDIAVTGNALQRTNGGDADAFLFVLNPAPGVSPNEQLIYSTYLGGAGPDAVYDAIADSAGRLYLTGLTVSDTFPVTANALQGKRRGGMAGFVSVLNLGGATPAFTYSSYLTSDGSQVGYGLDLGEDGRIHIAGFTTGSLLSEYGGAARTTPRGARSSFVLSILP